MLVNQGLAATFKVAWERLVQRFSARSDAYFHTSAFRQSAITVTAAVSTSSELSKPAHIHPFDLTYGVDTSGLIWGEHLASGSRNDRWSTAYYGIAPSVFNHVMAQLAPHIYGATFIDIGSGKGRAVMLAAHFPFAAVYGVEISAELHAIAQANISRCHQAAFRRATDIHLLCIDAVAFDFPLAPLVIYFYHPFCKPVLKRVMQRLQASLRAHPRPAHVIYINPELEQVLEASGFLTRIFNNTLTMSPEDQLADRVGSTTEECAIYVSTLPAQIA